MFCGCGLEMSIWNMTQNPSLNFKNVRNNYNYFKIFELFYNVIKTFGNRNFFNFYVNCN